MNSTPLQNGVTEVKQYAAAARCRRNLAGCTAGRIDVAEAKESPCPQNLSPRSNGMECGGQRKGRNHRQPGKTWRPKAARSWTIGRMTVAAPLVASEGEPAWRGDGKGRSTPVAAHGILGVLIASRQDYDCGRWSFRTILKDEAWVRLRHEEQWDNLRKVISELVVGKRPGRQEKRVLERRPKIYKLMTCPRNPNRKRYVTAAQAYARAI